MIRSNTMAHVLVYALSRIYGIDIVGNARASVNVLSNILILWTLLLSVSALSVKLQQINAAAMNTVNL